MATVSALCVCVCERERASEREEENERKIYAEKDAKRKQEDRQGKRVGILLRKRGILPLFYLSRQ